MSLNVPTELEKHIDEIVTHYPPQPHSSQESVRQTLM